MLTLTDMGSPAHSAFSHLGAPARYRQGTVNSHFEIVQDPELFTGAWLFHALFVTCRPFGGVIYWWAYL